MSVQQLKIHVEDADLADGTQQDRLTLTCAGMHVVSITKPAATTEAEHASHVRSLLYAVLHQDVVTTVHEASASPSLDRRASELAG